MVYTFFKRFFNPLTAIENYSTILFQSLTLITLIKKIKPIIYTIKAHKKIYNKFISKIKNVDA